MIQHQTSQWSPLMSVFLEETQNLECLAVLLGLLFGQVWLFERSLCRHPGV